MKLKKVVLEGERVKLRPYTIKDAADIREYCNEKTMHVFIPEMPYPYRRNHALEFIKTTHSNRRKGERLSLAIELNGKVIGGVGLHHFAKSYCEIGYTLSKKFRRKGLTYEAAHLLMDYAFGELGIYRMGAECNATNIASASLLRKLGFQEEGLFRKHVKVDGKRYDIKRFGILKNER